MPFLIFIVYHAVNAHNKLKKSTQRDAIFVVGYILLFITFSNHSRLEFRKEYYILIYIPIKPNWFTYCNLEILSLKGMRPFCVISIMQKSSLPQIRADYNKHVNIMKLRKHHI